ncbi:NUDIX domain-containing protein [Arcobacter sp. FWKO B]|uniref:NUDIX domain-containing protein n=1 Tax=Arcobacter sp. FWKO B TaxID=2593672 RepID=UPI0018A3F8EF|nr:NUDIX domain-containing protein [Arcobacter sp. FWKO B]QOG12998.1 NUDIX domain-containing protein [Arcobacter sp. FWKO B]
MSSVKSYGVAPYMLKDGRVYLFLCRASDSRYKWGFLKGTKSPKETPKECARREFYEESAILIEYDFFEEYFEQGNDRKDVGVWLVNAQNIKNLDKFLNKDLTLKAKYRSKEINGAGFFPIDDFPPIKNNQYQMMFEVVDFLKHYKLHG